MLERTAAGLESCNLQRLLVARSPRRGRRLHPAFWQNGAAALELIGQSPSPMRFAEPTSHPDLSCLPGSQTLLRRCLQLPYAQYTTRARRRCFASSNGPSDPFRTPVRRKKKATAAKEEPESRKAADEATPSSSTAKPSETAAEQEEGSGDEISRTTVRRKRKAAVAKDDTTSRKAADEAAPSSSVAKPVNTAAEQEEGSGDETSRTPVRRKRKPAAAKEDTKSRKAADEAAPISSAAKPTDTAAEQEEGSGDETSRTPVRRKKKAPAVKEDSGLHKAADEPTSNSSTTKLPENTAEAEQGSDDETRASPPSIVDENSPSPTAIPGTVTARRKASGSKTRAATPRSRKTAASEDTVSRQSGTDDDPATDHTDGASTPVDLQAEASATGPKEEAGSDDSALTNQENDVLIRKTPKTRGRKKTPKAAASESPTQDEEDARRLETTSPSIDTSSPETGPTEEVESDDSALTSQANDVPIRKTRGRKKTPKAAASEFPTQDEAVASKLEAASPSIDVSSPEISSKAEAEADDSARISQADDAPTRKTSKARVKKGASKTKVSKSPKEDEEGVYEPETTSSLTDAAEIDSLAVNIPETKALEAPASEETSPVKRKRRSKVEAETSPVDDPKTKAKEAPEPGETLTAGTAESSPKTTAIEAGPKKDIAEPSLKAGITESNFEASTAAPSPGTSTAETSPETPESPEDHIKVLSRDELQAEKVWAAMRSGDPETAEDLIRAGLAQEGLSGGIEHLIVYCIRRHEWMKLVSLWAEYFSTLDPREDPSNCRWPPIEYLPRRNETCLLFERFLELANHNRFKFIDSKRAVLALRRKMAETSLRQACDPLNAAVILDIFDDPNFYQRYLLLMLERWALGLETTNGLARLPDIYEKYRLLPRAKPSPALLHSMFKLCDEGTQITRDNIYRDWYKFWGGLDEKAFQQYLDFYAAAGDIGAVRHVWASYVASFPEALKVPETFRSILWAYAERAEPGMVERELRLIVEQYHVRPNTRLWNAVLRSYEAAEKWELMQHCFEFICKGHGPDSETYAIYMGLAGKRGDLETVISLFDQAQSRRIAVTPDMVRAVVTAYCHNDRLLAAERICHDLSERKLATTKEWNSLLKFNAIKGKIDKCQELLTAMNHFGIESNARTYDCLLRVMVKLKQVITAWRFLKNAGEKKLFSINDENFETVMLGAAMGWEYDLVGAIARVMLKTRPGPLTFNAQTALAIAAYAKAPSAEHTKEICREILPTLQALLPPEEDVDSGEREASEPPRLRVGCIALLRAKTTLIDRAVKVLIELRDFRTAEEVVNTYLKIFPQFRDAQLIPPRLGSSIMLGYLKEKKYKMALAVWQKIWRLAMVRCKGRNSATVYPSQRYNLTLALHTVIKTLAEAQDGNSIVNCVEQVLSVGFRLSRQTWNLVITSMAQLGKWERAMSWCETMLMPGWRGWEGEKVDLGPNQIRRLLSDSHVLSPWRPTIFSLQLEWLKARKLSAWSSEVANRVKQLERNHPMLHYAFITNDISRIPAAWTVPRSENLSQAIKTMLKPYSYRELDAMKSALARQLRFLGMKEDARRQRLRNRDRYSVYKEPDIDSSPFHVVVEGGVENASGTEFVRTKPMSLDELAVLNQELGKRLTEVADSLAPKPSSSSSSSSSSLAVSSTGALSRRQAPKP
ncbi:hypothetical protein CP533_2146 [Ophiocordyceps camponoti-saundersi (nom. inval.)]|nr:hypothetical protein CP533_2146 [Ophiocordyceps camponoti-saundersi (nom. inval.)]